MSLKICVKGIYRFLGVIFLEVLHPEIDRMPIIYSTGLKGPEGFDDDAIPPKARCAIQKLSVIKRWHVRIEGLFEQRKRFCR